MTQQINWSQKRKVYRHGDSGELYILLARGSFMLLNDYTEDGGPSEYFAPIELEWVGEFTNAQLSQGIDV